MTSPKPLDEVSKDVAADLAALRDDVAKLSSSVSEFIRTQTEATANTVFEAVDSARQRIAETAGKAQDRAGEMSSDIEATIERNPLSAMLIALAAGVVIGLLSRGRK